MEKERLQLEPLMNDQVTFQQAKAQGKNISLRLDPLPELPSVLANRRSIEEVISNLLTNAIKYTPDGGSVTLSAGVERGYVRISVKDTGFGIDRDDLDRIFERFYRVKNDKTRLITGTGLGLAIVKSIMDAHNGMIRVESEIGQGTTFHVYLPIMLD
jgi:signal transduction histidine kinase